MTDLGVLTAMVYLFKDEKPYHCWHAPTDTGGCRFANERVLTSKLLWPSENSFYVSLWVEPVQLRGELESAELEEEEHNSCLSQLAEKMSKCESSKRESWLPGQSVSRFLVAGLDASIKFRLTIGRWFYTMAKESSQYVLKFSPFIFTYYSFRFRIGKLLRSWFMYVYVYYLTKFLKIKWVALYQIITSILK